MATCFGWTWEYIDEFVTLPRCYEIWAVWKRCPPLHIAVVRFAQYFGALKTTPDATSTARPNDDDGALLRDLGALGVGNAPTLPPDLRAMMLHDGTT